MENEKIIRIFDSSDFDIKIGAGCNNWFKLEFIKNGKLVTGADGYELWSVFCEGLIPKLKEEILKLKGDIKMQVIEINELQSENTTLKEAIKIKTKKR